MNDTTNAVPNPGSTSALNRGCICAVLDNAHGQGYMGNPNRFVITEGCPVHAPGSIQKAIQLGSDKGDS